MGPHEAVFPFLDARERRALGAAAEPRPRPVVDLPARSARSRHRRRRLSRSTRPAARRRVADRRRRCSIRRARSSPAVGAARRRRAQHRRRGGFGAAVLRMSSPRPSARGGAACRPLVPRDGLSESAGRSGAGDLAPRRRRVAFRRAAARARIRRRPGRRFRFDSEAVALAGGGRAVVLAVPAASPTRLVPGLIVPDHLRAIVNAHYRAAAPGGSPPFRRRDRRRRGMGVPQARGAVGDGERRRAAHRPAGRRARRDAVARCRGGLRASACAAAAGAHRQGAPRDVSSPAPTQLRRRPAAATRWRNLVLAGDWTDTGLPATIEGAIRSGLAAARLAARLRAARALPAKAPSRRLPRRQPTRSLGENGSPISDERRHRCSHGGGTRPSRRRRRCRPAGRRDRRATDALMRAQHDDGHWALRARGRCDDPGRIYPAAALSRRDRRRARGAHRAHYLRVDQGEHGGWPLFHGGEFDLSGSRQGLFRAEGRRRRRRRAAYGARARGDPGARRARRVQRLHPHPAGAVRRGAVARGAGHAGRDHAAAALVPVPPQQGVVLVAHRARAAAGADGEAAARAQPARRDDPRAVRRGPREGARLDRRADRLGAGRAFAVLDRVLRVVEPMFPARSRRRAIDAAVAFVTERLNGEDGLGGIFPAIANSRDDVRLPRLCRRTTPMRDRARRRCASCWCSSPSGSYCQPCLSPVWDTGARLSRADGSGRPAARRRRRARA